MPTRDMTVPTLAGMQLLRRIRDAGGHLVVRRSTPGSPDKSAASIQAIRALDALQCITHEHGEHGLVALDITDKGMAVLEIGKARAA